MRYTVRFAHARYIDVVARFVRDPGYDVPEGVYRGLDVVVEAPDPPAALALAAQRLGWPDAEVHLVPYSVVPSLQARADLEAILGVRAVLDFWREAQLTAAEHGLEAAVGLAGPEPAPARASTDA